MQNAIFHVHTYRCRHMHDDKRENEYIEKAIELGAKQIWFTDHAPFEGDSIKDRMFMEQLPEYVATLKALKQQYADKIDIKIGLEMEYVPTFHDYYVKLRKTYDFDVYLLGQHFSLLEDGRFSFELEDKSDEARILAKGMIEGMKSGFFDVVAHPDQIFRRCPEWNEETEAIAQEIKQWAAVTKVILEKNVCNMIGKKKKNSFRPEFWRDLPEGVETIYGLDAHSVKELEENYLTLQSWS